MYLDLESISPKMISQMREIMCSLKISLQERENFWMEDACLSLKLQPKDLLVRMKLFSTWTRKL